MNQLSLFRNHCGFFNDIAALLHIIIKTDGREENRKGDVTWRLQHTQLVSIPASYIKKT